MNVQALEGSTDKRILRRNRRFAGLWQALCWFILLWSGGVVAQVETQALQQDAAEEIAELVVSLPTSAQMALALATPELRNEVLLDLAAAKNVLSFAKQSEAVEPSALAQKFLDDRGWLARLIDRYGWSNPHSGVLDPAAWLVLSELQQHDLRVMSLVHPDQTPQAVLVYQVFQRAGEGLAAANLPILLLRLEAEAIPVWSAFLQLTGNGGNPGAEWKAVEAEWFAERQFPLPIESNDAGQEADSIQVRQRTKQESAREPAREPERQRLIAQNLQTLSQMVLSTVDAGPPDARRLRALRYALISDVSQGETGLVVVEPEQDRDLLYLASLVDGLHEGRYFNFVRGLLAITAGLLDRSQPPAAIPLLVDWLIAELPAISAHYAVDFAAVDPQLNSAMSAAYKVLQNVANPADDTAKASRAMLADAVAQLALMIPDMGYYFHTPMRSKIAEEINVCTSIAASRDAQGDPAMTRSQFDACVENFVQLADQEIRLAELSGNFDGPFNTDSLQRELSITPEQRINYGIGYLYNRYSSDCPPPATAMPNPLEWAVLATTMTWFAENSPEFFMTAENESRLARMRSIGDQLIQGLARQASCYAGTDGNGPVNRIMADYEAALRALTAGITEAEADFRTRRLRPGADITLERDASQRTAYRPEDLIIEPCNPRLVCEMTGNLSTTRALIGLFPDEFLVAEQSGLGRIEICYRNMEWVERRSELVRPDDKNVANYFGRLGFDLVGRYIENDRSNELFGFRFKSPDEHLYLFAQASEEVLQDSCPVEWVGTRVITPLREDRGGMVPDRLTYLAASRALPSRLLQGNWDRGAEWRDWFVTGIGVSSFEVAPIPDIKPRLNQHLQSLYQAEQADIYQRVLLKSAHSPEGDDISLFDEMSQVSIAKALLHMQIMLFYPDSIARSDSIRMEVAGDTGLLERRTLLRFREDNVALTTVNQVALERLRRLQQAWSRQSVAERQQGSISASLMHAMTRINYLYRQMFISRPEPLEEIPEQAQGQGGQSQVPE